MLPSTTKFVNTTLITPIRNNLQTTTNYSLTRFNGRQQNILSINKRRLGHDAHSEHHHHAEPRFLNEPEGRIPHQYELPTNLLLVLGSAAALVFYFNKPETNIAAWARDEAIARNKMRENGEEITRGVNHAQQARFEELRAGWKKS
jgi:hypothetical protein